MEILAEYSYWGLFLASFLAATILPFSSELILGYLLTHDFNVFVTVFAATSGNVLGAIVNYGLGFWGGNLLLHRVFRVSDLEITKAENRFKKYGILSLLFAWVPIIGDPLTVAAGMLKIRFVLFLFLVGLGKFLRYVFVAWVVLSI
jgi:membrane protein YqaA with SNARE-associated domain